MKKIILMTALTVALAAALSGCSTTKGTEETGSSSDALFTSEDVTEETSGTKTTAEETSAVTDGSYDGYYSAVTALDKSVVEEFAARMRQAYLDGDWDVIAENIRYPITLYPDEEINDQEEFLDYVKSRTVYPDDEKALRDDPCTDMFFNGEGICLGSGQIWFYDASYMTTRQPKLEIIQIAGFA